MRYKFLGLALLVAGCFYLYRFADSQFRYENIALDASFFPVIEEERLKPETVTILNQPFYYLDHGKQSFVFVSQDGLYVLKFFDRSRYRQWRNKVHARAKMEQAVRGYLVANRVDRDHVAILYMHQASKNLNLPVIALSDRFGLTHKIDLTLVPFVLQRKAVPTRVLISEYLDRGDCLAVQKAFDALKQMYVDEHQRGVLDLDRNLMHNTGFIGNTPIRMDAGRLVIDESMKDPFNSQRELRQIREKRINGWLKRHYPNSQCAISSFQ